MEPRLQAEEAVALLDTALAPGGAVELAAGDREASFDVRSQVDAAVSAMDWTSSGSGAVLQRLLFLGYALEQAAPGTDVAWLRASADRALRAMGKDAAARHLVEAISTTEDPPVLDALVAAMVRARPSGAVDGLRAAAGTTTNGMQRLAALRALHEAFGDAEATERLRSIARDGSEAPDDRARAICSLGHHADLDVVVRAIDERQLPDAAMPSVLASLVRRTDLPAAVDEHGMRTRLIDALLRWHCTAGAPQLVPVDHADGRRRAREVVLRLDGHDRLRSALLAELGLVAPGWAGSSAASGIDGWDARRWADAALQQPSDAPHEVQVLSAEQRAAVAERLEDLAMDAAASAAPSFRRDAGGSDAISSYVAAVSVLLPVDPRSAWRVSMEQLAISDNWAVLCCSARAAAAAGMAMDDAPLDILEKTLWNMADRSRDTVDAEGGGPELERQRAVLLAVVQETTARPPFGHHDRVGALHDQPDARANDIAAVLHFLATSGDAVPVARYVASPRCPLGITATRQLSFYLPPAARPAVVDELEERLRTMVKRELLRTSGPAPVSDEAAVRALELASCIDPAQATRFAVDAATRSGGWQTVEAAASIAARLLTTADDDVRRWAREPLLDAMERWCESLESDADHPNGRGALKAITNATRSATALDPRTGDARNLRRQRPSGPATLSL